MFKWFNNLYVIFFLLINNLNAISPQGRILIETFNIYDNISKVGDKLDLRIAEVEFIYAVKAWEKWRGIRYSYKLKNIQRLFRMYKRLITTGKIK